MMSVRKYKLNIGNSGPKNIKIPLNLDYNSVGQSEAVNAEFVKDEVENSINPIIDYEQTKYKPKLSDGTLVNDLRYNLIFLDGNKNLLEPKTFYSDIGFNDDDIKFRKNRFKKSFLRLNFYDSDRLTNQNLVSIITLFNKIYTTDLIDYNVGSSNESPIGGGTPKPASSIPVRFILDDPMLKPKGNNEGFNIYYNKSIVKKNDAIPKELYMRAEYNNASTGESSRFITTTETLPINELVNKIHVRYLLTRDETGYYYTIDSNYKNANNIIENGNNLEVNLYEIKVQ